MEVDSKARRMRIRIVGYFKNARMINTVMKQLESAKDEAPKPSKRKKARDVKQSKTEGPRIEIRGDDIVLHPLRRARGASVKSSTRT